MRPVFQLHIFLMMVFSINASVQAQHILNSYDPVLEVPSGPIIMGESFTVDFSGTRLGTFDLNDAQSTAYLFTLGDVANITNNHVNDNSAWVLSYTFVNETTNELTNRVVFRQKDPSTGMDTGLNLADALSLPVTTGAMNFIDTAGQYRLSVSFFTNRTCVRFSLFCVYGTKTFDTGSETISVDTNRLDRTFVGTSASFNVVAAVPEPHGALLFLPALGVLIWRRQQKKTRSL